MAVADVMKMVKENDIKFVDFRFTDTKGKEQHVSVPISAFNEEKFTEGHAFDGSSISGWKGIQASDMQLMPDPDSANPICVASAAALCERPPLRQINMTNASRSTCILR